MPKDNNLIQAKREELVQAALTARLRSYCPYSRYQVGAALLLEDGTIVLGCNVENAAYPSTICAERCAVFSAVALHNRSGHLDAKPNILACAVATRDGGASCGGCRQVLNEFNRNMILWMVDETGKIRQEATVADLLPLAFDPSSLSSRL